MPTSVKNFTHIYLIFTAQNQIRLAPISKKVFCLKMWERRLAANGIYQRTVANCFFYFFPNT